MSTNDPSTPPAGGPGQPSEAELMAAYEEQMKNVRVEEVVVQSLASFIELGGRRAGLVPGAQEEADTAQLGVAIEAIRALQPVVAPLLGPNAGQVDQALSQLQLAYAQQTGGSGGGEDSEGGSGGPGGPGGPGAGGPGSGGPGPGGPGPDAPRQGGQGGPSRLWVPGQ